MLYVHGFTDYFFQQHLAEHFASQGYRFFALDLRKCGRSRTENHTPHFVTDLAYYDAELDEALRLVRAETGGGRTSGRAFHGRPRVAVVARPAEQRPGGTAGRGISGVVLNSPPWFDLQGPAYLRNVGTVAIDVLGRLRPKNVIPPAQKLDTYGGEPAHRRLELRPRLETAGGVPSHVRLVAGGTARTCAVASRTRHRGCRR